MIILINEVLPTGFGHVLKHSLLVSPTGRPNHLVSKYFHLEIQNYWIKYFYNHSGVGTNIHRLKDVLSINIPLLQKLVTNIKDQSGKKVIFQ